MSNSIHVGIDDGHDGIKIYLGSADGVGEEVKNQIASKAEFFSTATIVDVAAKELDNMTITVNSIDGKEEEDKYIVNSDYVENKIETRTDEYPCSSLNLALIHQCLREVRPHIGDITKVKVIAGLPANQYYSKVDGGKNIDLINSKIENIKTLYRVSSPADSNLSNKGSFEVVAVDVVPEGYGIAFNLMFDNDLNETQYLQRFKDYGCVVIDIGGRTVDIVTVLPRSCKPKGSGLLSFDKGVLFLRERIASTLMERYKLKSNLDENSIDIILRTNWIGVVDSPKGINVTQDLIEIKKSHVAEIYKSVSGVLDSNEARGGVILSGGGTVLLGDMLQEIIEGEGSAHQCEVIRPDDAVFGNAKGFWKMSWVKNG